ncbi:ELWxxDGT repeat protein [Myxococcus sp. RHSTA-1-4]|uniref:ELWxxDGT repeat protein n=1 Tax=Myxococcus sp. RHSTA-1-4 TaxID=2874601 RepID=UPI001CC1645B|nr:ELWxxDGT repeat protein [Myxococcus sp. RHSTA-1-4]MBZ4422408.1 hypothetical protein [Myxococcus sp. RHSTA-1-4]
MKSWRGVPVLMFMLSGVVVGCGPGPEDEVAVAAPESEAADAAATGASGPELLANRWEVCDDVARRVPGISGAVDSGEAPPVHGHRRLFFVASDEAHGPELWATTGEASDTALVKDVWPGRQGSTPRHLTAMGRWVYFVAADENHGPELWRTDGTEKGTELVRDIQPGPVGSAPDALTVVEGALYFTAYDEVHGRELWRSDGTEKGTVLVRDFVPGPRPGPNSYSEGLTQLTAWDKGLALVAYAHGQPAVLWWVDRKGRASPLFSLDYGAFLELEPAGRQLFFTVDAGTDEADLWVTRSSPGSATKLRHFPGEYPSYFTAMGDAVYFVAGGEGWFGPGDPEHGSELWTSDGTEEGTRLLRDISPGPESAFSFEFLPQFVTTEGVLYFVAHHREYGRELWRSDGTPAGTSLVRDVVPGEAGSAPSHLAADSGWVFFSADTPGEGREAWYSSGRFWDTKPLADLSPGTASSNPRYFVRSGWDIFFIASDAMGGQELWSVPFRPAARCGERNP